MGSFLIYLSFGSSDMNLFITIIVLVLKSCCLKSILCQTCTKETCEIEEGVVIHWDLNGMEQNDPKLIEAIKSKVLIQPPTKQKLELKLPTSMKFINGQYGQPSAIEKILKSKKLWKKKLGREWQKKIGKKVKRQ